MTTINDNSDDNANNVDSDNNENRDNDANSGQIIMKMNKNRKHQKTNNKRVNKKAP